MAYSNKVSPVTLPRGCARLRYSVTLTNCNGLPGGSALEVQWLTAKRPIEERFLATFCLPADRIPHLTVQKIYLQPRLLNVSEQGFGERTVLDRAVLCGGTMLGGIGDQHIALRFDVGKTPANRPAGSRAAHHACKKRIVAAGI